MSKVDLEKVIEAARKLDAISLRTDLDDVRGIVSAAVVSLFQFAEEVERLRRLQHGLVTEINEADDENARLQEALEFYGDEENWTPEGTIMSRATIHSCLTHDSGRIARAALKEKP